MDEKQRKIREVFIAYLIENEERKPSLFFFFALCIIDSIR